RLVEPRLELKSGRLVVADIGPPATHPCRGVAPETEWTTRDAAVMRGADADLAIGSFGVRLSEYGCIFRSVRTSSGPAQRAAAARTIWIAGNSRPMRTAIKAITTSSSISVKARCWAHPLRAMAHTPSGEMVSSRVWICEFPGPVPLSLTAPLLPRVRGGDYLP